MSRTSLYWLIFNLSVEDSTDRQMHSFNRHHINAKLKKPRFRISQRQSHCCQDPNPLALPQPRSPDYSLCLGCRTHVAVQLSWAISACSTSDRITRVLFSTPTNKWMVPRSQHTATQHQNKRSGAVQLGVGEKGRTGQHQDSQQPVLLRLLWEHRSITPNPPKPHRTSYI